MKEIEIKEQPRTFDDVQKQLSQILNLLAIPDDLIPTDKVLTPEIIGRVKGLQNLCFHIVHDIKTTITSEAK